MSNTFTVPREAFAAVALAMAKNEARYYLCGMQIEHGIDGSFIVATDGHRLHAYRLLSAMNEGVPYFKFLLPASNVQKIVKDATTKAQKETPVQLALPANYDTVGNPAYLTHTLLNGGTLSMPPIDKSFPNWRRPVSDALTSAANNPVAEPHDGLQIDFSPKYLADAWRSGRILDRPLLAAFCGPSPAVFATAAADFIALVMPRTIKRLPKSTLAELETSFVPKLP